MIKKGIILAGGSGTRLSPLTKAVNKQLLPIHDKPMIFYPLSVMMLANIKNILIIVNPGQIENFKNLLGDGSRYGIRINYKIQLRPKGLHDGWGWGESGIGNDNVALILGDNFFYGQSLTQKLEKSSNHKTGATVFLKEVSEPENFGVAKINKNKIEKIIEKPKNFISKNAITGLYFFDKNVCKFAKKLKPSNRGELEITDVNKVYLKKKQLKVEAFGRGFAWLDTGTPDSLLNANNFIATIEKGQGLKVACLEEISFNNNWISKEELKNLKGLISEGPYKSYLSKILKK